MSPYLLNCSASSLLNACIVLVLLAGIARTLLYKGTVTEPLYRLLPDGTISDGTHDIGHSFFREYKFKLEKLYDRFLTQKGAELAKERQAIAKAYYESLYREVNEGYTTGQETLTALLEETV